MDWSRVIFDVIAAALVTWALVGLWISASKDPRAHSTPPPPVLEILELLKDLVPSAGERERLWARVDALERRASVHAIDHQALDKRLTALADRANALELAVTALRERMEERGESSDEDPKHAVTPTPAVEPASITEAARARARRWIRATDNRHPATENDPVRGSATAEKP